MTKDLLYRIAKRAHLQKFVFHIFSFIFGRKHAIHEHEIIDSNKLLHTISENPRTTSLCSNEYVPADGNFQYDLQIVIPVYNQEKYIEECLNSIAQQQTTYKYIAIVVNDGSTDSTLEKIEKYRADDRFLIIDQENRGFSGARNRGLEKIYAQYVMFVDSDDVLENGSIENLMNEAYKNHADIVEGSAIKFDNRNQVIKQYHHDLEQNTYGKKLNGFPWGKVYRSNLFKTVHFPEGYWFEDTICSLLIFPQAKVTSTIPNLVYKYRNNESGISNSFVKKPKVVDSYYVTELLMREHAQLQISEKHYAEKVLRQFIMNCSRIDSLEREDVKKSLFVLQAALYKKYVMPLGQKVAEANLRLFETALLKGDYFSYLLYQKLL